MFMGFRIGASSRVLKSCVLLILGTVVIAACGTTATGITLLETKSKSNRPRNSHALRIQQRLRSPKPVADGAREIQAH